MNHNSASPTSKPKSVWSLGSYSEIALFLVPVSAHLVKLCNISSDDSVLDVACRTGDSTITSRRKGAKVTGVDITPGDASPSKAESSLAETDDIVWKEGIGELSSF